MTKTEYKDAIRKLTQEWLDAELKRANNKQLTTDGVDINIEVIPSVLVLEGKIDRYHVGEITANMIVSL